LTISISPGAYSASLLCYSEWLLSHGDFVRNYMKQKTHTSFSTPMMKQYASIKKKYKDCLLFFRLGDFYELFLEDAQIGAQILDIALTSRPKGKDGKIPMAGVPYHAVDAYLAKLVKAGYKVAICEQISEPNKYGIVDRDVVRVVTPGTVFDEKILDRKENNYIIALISNSTMYSVAICDISTGYLETFEKTYINLEQDLLDLLIKVRPVECILPENLYNNPEVLRILKSVKNLAIYRYPEWDIYAKADTLLSHFGVSSVRGFGIHDMKLAQQVCGALVGYLLGTQKGKLGHIKKIKIYQAEKFVALDKSTIVNLELFSTIRDHEISGTLLSTIDKTKTAMGARLLKDWLIHPLRRRQSIVSRLDAVSELLSNREQRNALRELLSTIPDIERLISRLSVGIGNARDLITLKSALQRTIQAKHILVKSNSILLQNIQKEISTKLTLLVEYIDEHIVEDPPFSVKDGGIINDGVDSTIDDLRKIVNRGKDWVTTLEKQEKETTGIASLKVRFNKVFGFYIEVSNSNLENVPTHYIRKQTLVNGERFITPELKDWEVKIVTADTEVKEKEYNLFTKVLDSVLQKGLFIQKSANSIAILDCIMSFADCAEFNGYSRPQLLYSGEIDIKEGRHPVVEKSIPNKSFVPNSILLNNIKQPLLILTGPNMAGKSVLIRQVAIIVLLSHIGSFVPASRARVSIVDKIFVRSGASDMISSGLSTFMVEMVETAYILNNATKDSLIIMDEIGRGTSTYDGISIAQAIAEYIVTNFSPPPKTLFATHYHELQMLESMYPNKVRNFHMAVEQHLDAPIFMYTLKSGGASHSFGIAVAKLAGVPTSVISASQKHLSILEQTKDNTVHSSKNEIDGYNSDIIKQIREIPVNSITPLQALGILSDLQKEL
jgi:DNA mismatch repair protein MutS